MSRTDNNISGAAKLLGISRPTLYDLLKQYRLSA
jgi:two-component system NtrC family response regulator